MISIAGDADTGIREYALGDNLEKLEKLEQKGVIIVFGCLENPKNIEKNSGTDGFSGDL